VFITKLKAQVNIGIKENSNQTFFSVYPNPGRLFTVKYDATAFSGSLRVKNGLGQTLLSREIKNRVSNQEIIDLGHLVSGIYFIELSTGKATEIKKIVVE